MIVLDLCKLHYQNMLITSIECKKCMGREKINSECRFVRLKNDKLIYRCRDCKEKWERLIEGLIRKFSSTYQFCNDDMGSIWNKKSW